MASKKTNNKTVNIRRYRYPHINIGVIFFFVVMVYVIFYVFTYATSVHIVRYEVKEGSLATDNTYTGLVIRKESVYTLDVSGYVNYYAGEGERVAVGDLIYTVDETGRLNEYLESLAADENALSEKELSDFKNEIVNYMHSYDSNSYNNVYDFKNTLNGSLNKLANNNILKSIHSLKGSDGVANIINYRNADGTGIISYWLDGYEYLTADQVTEEMFDKKNYERRQLTGTDLKAAGDVAYKLSTDENWSVVIPIDAQKGAYLLEQEYVKVRFLKNQYESWGKVDLKSNPDGNLYLSLSFSNSMVTFVSDRFLDIEIVLNDDKGLKIPLSSIVTKEFFLVPEEFVCTEETHGVNGVYKQVYNEDGTVSVQLVEMDLYNFDEVNRFYYLDNTLLSAGDILHRNDSQDTYVVSHRATLIGVYNINKGYADFKQISILYQNEEYAIVKPNTEYGLRVYDYIVLDAEAVADDQFINY